jgi:hypothetical protein
VALLCSEELLAMLPSMNSLLHMILFLVGFVSTETLLP